MPGKPEPTDQVIAPWVVKHYRDSIVMTASEFVIDAVVAEAA